MTVQIPPLSSAFSAKNPMGGENQRGSFTLFSGYSATAQCIGKARSYLEPNSGSLHVPIEGRVAIGEKTARNHDENAERIYLEPIRNRMHEPIEGLLRIPHKDYL